ncbi:MAG: hypothetical protein IPJ65_35010 [Archangiaceae bacterium]|nr:hypothetical protein [Archangiaceae bacterium]
MRAPFVGVAVCLFSASSLAGEQLHLAIPGFSAVGMPDSRANFFSEHLGAALARAGARVTTAKTVSEVLGLERQKQLLGCSDSGCTIELANALGADGIISGEVAALTSSLQCNVKLLSSRSGEVIEAIAVRASSDEALLDELENAAQRLALIGATRLNKQLSAGSPGSSGGGLSVRRLSFVPAAVGVAAAIAGAALLVGARGQLEAIPTSGSAISATEAQTHVSNGRGLETGGWVAVGVGCAAVAAAVVMFAVGGKPSTVTAALTPLPSGGAMVGLGGAF